MKLLSVLAFAALLHADTIRSQFPGFEVPCDGLSSGVQPNGCQFGEIHKAQQPRQRRFRHSHRLRHWRGIWRVGPVGDGIWIGSAGEVSGCQICREDFSERAVEAVAGGAMVREFRRRRA